MLPEIEVIDIQLLKEEFIDRLNLKSLLTFKGKSTKIRTNNDSTLKEKYSQEENPKQDSNTTKLTKMELMETFACEENCDFLEYELN